MITGFPLHIHPSTPLHPSAFSSLQAVSLSSSPPPPSLSARTPTNTHIPRHRHAGKKNTAGTHCKFITLLIRLVTFYMFCTRMSHCTMSQRLRGRRLGVNWCPSLLNKTEREAHKHVDRDKGIARAHSQTSADVISLKRVISERPD